MSLCIAVNQDREVGFFGRSLHFQIFSKLGPFDVFIAVLLNILFLEILDFCVILEKSSNGCQAQDFTLRSINALPLNIRCYFSPSLRPHQVAVESGLCEYW